MSIQSLLCSTTGFVVLSLMLYLADIPFISLYLKILPTELMHLLKQSPVLLFNILLL